MANRPPRPPLPPLHSLLAVPWGRIAILLALAVPMAVNLWRAPPWRPAPVVPPLVQAQAAGPALEEVPMWATDLDESAPPAPPGGREVPRTRLLEGQRPAPCLPPDQVQLGVGCWVQVARKPPCGDTFFRDSSACYLPVLTARRPSSFGGQ